MTEEELRLECLRMATIKVNYAASCDAPLEKSDIEVAQEYFAFVTSSKADK